MYLSRVLIPTHVDDMHAAAVAVALRNEGHQVALWHGADYPSRQVASISVSEEEGLRWHLEGPEIALDSEPFDVVWMRRPTQPVLPLDGDLHPGDRHVAERECGRFYRSLWLAVAPDAFWVNPMTARNRALCKPLQLREAVHAGLRVPPTLCSNDPDRIRRFLDAHSGEAIFKTFAPVQWKLADGVAMGFANTVTADDLPDDEILRMCPGIFQHRVAKDYELRVTYMGHHAVTARLLSQQSTEGRVDYRAAFTSIDIEPATLPAEVDRGCRALMERMGLVFGCFDLIVTPEGEHVFIEINEMGQFLWIEQLCPELLTLDAFCAFLRERRRDFTWQPSADPLRFADVVEAAQEQCKQDQRTHLPRPRNEMADDDPSGSGQAEISGTSSHWCEACQEHHGPGHSHDHQHHHNREAPASEESLPAQRA